jgi:hypothetical protein
MRFIVILLTVIILNAPCCLSVERQCTMAKSGKYHFTECQSAEWCGTSPTLPSFRLSSAKTTFQTEKEKEKEKKFCQTKQKMTEIITGPRHRQKQYSTLPQRTVHQFNESFK